MSIDPKTKADRRQLLRQSFPSPLDRVALRHVDAICALASAHVAVLAEVTRQVGVEHTGHCLQVLKTANWSIGSASSLTNSLGFLANSKARENNPSKESWMPEINQVDQEYLERLLRACHPGLPETTVSGLVTSDVTAPILGLISAIRLTLTDQYAHFNRPLLHTLCEETLTLLADISNGQRST